MLEAATTSGVKVAVLEFTGPPIGQRLEPVSPGSLGNLGEVLDGSLVGLVLTRFPVHPQQFQLFNQGFYEALRHGDPLPQAVQEGRRQLRETPALEDAAGFGCFTLITGPSSELRLTTPRSVGATEHAPRTQSYDASAEPGPQRDDAHASTRDEFVGGRR